MSDNNSSNKEPALFTPAWHEWHAKIMTEVLSMDNERRADLDDDDYDGETTMRIEKARRTHEQIEGASWRYV